MTYGWSPFREMNRLSGEMDRAFDHWNTGTWRLPFSRVSFLPARSARAYPLLNVSEDADAIHVEALAPSIDAESLEVSVKGATLIGNGPDALTRVQAIGNDLQFDPGIGTCGKDGQGVPVGVGQPTMLIEGLTVGGTAA